MAAGQSADTDFKHINDFGVAAFLDLFAGSDICMESDATATRVINEVLVWLGLGC